MAKEGKKIEVNGRPSTTLRIAGANGEDNGGEDWLGSKRAGIPSLPGWGRKECQQCSSFV